MINDDFIDNHSIILMTIFVIGIIFLILLPAGILLGFDYLTKWKYHWIAWSIIFIGMFLFNVWLIFRRKK